MPLGVRSILTTAAAASACAGLWSACLADLPAPKSCPPDAKHQAGECGSLLNGQANPGPLDTSVLECLAGAREGGSCSCAGAGVECPNAGAACYPAGDCPPPVRASFAGASCSAIGQGDVAPGCGCIECATACDGVGPVFGAVVPPGAPDAGGSNTPIAGFALSLPQPLPHAGVAGVYVRARGIAEPQQIVVTMTGGGGSSSSSPGTQPIDLPSDSSFGYTTVFTSWTDPSDAPQAVLLVLAGPPSMSARAVVEVDCIVPFIVAP